MEMENYTTTTIEKSKDLKDVNLRLAGLITDAFHGVNQRGNGYCKFTLQDYDGSETYNLYNESYKKFNSLIHPGEVIFLEGTYSRGFNSDNYFFRIILDPGIL